MSGAPHNGRTAVDDIADIAPKLAQLTDEVVFGDMWERPGLSKRDRSLITVAALIALYRTEQLPIHLRRALANGCSPDELVEAITHLAFYAGWPNAFTAINLAKTVFAEGENAPGLRDDVELDAVHERVVVDGSGVRGAVPK